MMKRSIRIATSIAMVFALGCASANTQGRASAGTGNTITADQLARTNSEYVYDALLKLRPSWLTSRGATSITDATPTSVSVFMGNTLLGKAESLRDIRVVDVSEVKYWDAASASARFGMGHPRGVIELTRK
jgi:hypothetical protein